MITWRQVEEFRPQREKPKVPSEFGARSQQRRKLTSVSMEVRLGRTRLRSQIHNPTDASCDIPLRDGTAGVLLVKGNYKADWKPKILSRAPYLPALARAD